MQPLPDLSKYEHTYYAGRSRVVEALWFFVGLPILRSRLQPFSAVSCALLRLFGAEIGANTVIKPGVRIKHPWLFRAGHNVWIGEDCWIDNLALVSLGNNVCVSQGAYLCTGNHDWSHPAFALYVRPIVIQDGVWIGARSIVGPGALIGEGAVLALGSVNASGVPHYEVHGGNPSKFICKRTVSDVATPARAMTASL